MSSLLIKGNIMPLTCEECPCYDANDNSCNATGQGVIEYIYSGRPDNCPLFEIPTPHGRLIEADRLLKVLSKNSIISKITHANGDSIEDIIRKAPTIIEAEVSE